MVSYTTRHVYYALCLSVCDYLISYLICRTTIYVRWLCPDDATVPSRRAVL